MSSPLQVQANRLNAKKSTGPRTPRGKAVARNNAVRHGITSCRPVLLDGESKTRWEKFAAAVFRALQPQGPIESFWASRIALHQWQLLRCPAARQALARQQWREAIVTAPQSAWWEHRRKQDKPLPVSTEDALKALRIHRREQTLLARAIAWADASPEERRRPVTIDPATVTGLLDWAAKHLGLDDAIADAMNRDNHYPGLKKLDKDPDPEHYDWKLEYVHEGLAEIAGWATITFADLISTLLPAMKQALKVLQSRVRRAQRELRNFRGCTAAQSIVQMHKFDQYEANLERRLRKAEQQLRKTQLQRGFTGVTNVAKAAPDVVMQVSDVASPSSSGAQASSTSPKIPVNKEPIGFVSSEPARERTIQ